MKENQLKYKNSLHFRTAVSEWRIVAYGNYFVNDVRCFVKFLLKMYIIVYVSIVQCLLLNSRCFLRVHLSKWYTQR